MRALRASEERAIELLMLAADDPRLPELKADPLVDFVLKDSEADVLCPATKLWNTGNGANVMREAVSLMGGYGITEDCPASSPTSGWTRSWKRPTRGRRQCSGGS